MKRQLLRAILVLLFARSLSYSKKPGIGTGLIAFSSFGHECCCSLNPKPINCLVPGLEAQRDPTTNQHIVSMQPAFCSNRKDGNRCPNARVAGNKIAYFCAKSQQGNPSLDIDPTTILNRSFVGGDAGIG